MIMNCWDLYMKRGRPTNQEKFSNKNHDHCVSINITIPQKLLNNVEERIEGKSRSEKIVNCVLAGYAVMT